MDNQKLNALVGMMQNKQKPSSPTSPAFGTNAPSQKYGDTLGKIVSAVQTYQQGNPVQTPFAPGTKTHAAVEGDRNYQLARQSAARAASGANRAASSQAFGQLMDIWKASGKAPAGIPGVTPGTIFGGEQGANPLDPLDSAKLYDTAFDFVKSDPDYFDEYGGAIEGANIQDGITKWMNIITQGIPGMTPAIPNNNPNPGAPSSMGDFKYLEAIGDYLK